MVRNSHRFACYLAPTLARTRWSSSTLAKQNPLGSTVAALLEDFQINYEGIPAHDNNLVPVDQRNRQLKKHRCSSWWKHVLQVKPNSHPSQIRGPYDETLSDDDEEDQTPEPITPYAEAQTNIATSKDQASRVQQVLEEEGMLVNIKDVEKAISHAHQLKLLRGASAAAEQEYQQASAHAKALLVVAKRMHEHDSISSPMVLQELGIDSSDHEQRRLEIVEHSSDQEVDILGNPNEFPVTADDLAEFDNDEDNNGETEQPDDAEYVDDEDEDEDEEANSNGQFEEGNTENFAEPPHTKESESEESDHDAPYEEVTTKRGTSRVSIVTFS
jgi:hypothetical protein